MPARVLLCEREPLLAGILTAVFTDEGLEVTQCPTLEDIEVGLDRFPNAIVVVDSWTDSAHRDLSRTELDAIQRLALQTHVIVTTGRVWAQSAPDLGFGPQVTVMPKPYDLEDLLQAVRRRAFMLDGDRSCAAR